jgi:hypothetical protein
MLHDEGLQSLFFQESLACFEINNSSSWFQRFIDLQIAAGRQE